MLTIMLSDSCSADFFLYFYYGQGSKAQVSFQCANNYKTPGREVSRSRLPLTRAIDIGSTLVGGFLPVVLTLCVSFIPASSLVMHEVVGFNKCRMA